LNVEILWHSLLWGVNAHVLYPIGGYKDIFIDDYILITVNKRNKMIWWWILIVERNTMTSLLWGVEVYVLYPIGGY
jgi:hypothetical protein